MVLAGICMYALSAPAQEKSFSAAVSQTSISLDQSIILTLMAEGIEPDRAPDIGDIPGFTVVYHGESSTSSSQISIVVNGRQQSVQRTKSIKYQYELIPQKAGQFTVPSFAVTAKGQTYRTDPIRINVGQEASGDERDVFVAMTVSDETPCVEQPVVVELKWYFSKNIESFSLSIPFLPAFKNFIVKNIEPDTSQHDYEKIPYNNQAVDFFVKSTELVNGKRFVVLTLQKIFIPISSGTYTLEPAVLRCDVIQGQQRVQDSFGFGGFFSRTRNVVDRRVARTDALTLTVQPLPPAPDGYPDNVSVGNYTCNVSISPQTVAVGDPVTVSVMIQGTGNIEGIIEPVFDDLDNFRRFEEDAEIEATITPNGIKGSKTFQTLLIPQSTAVSAIPSVTFYYYDPDRGAYQKKQTRPIPIKVEPAKDTTQQVMLSAPQQDAKGSDDVKIYQTDLPGYIKFSPGTLIYKGQFLYHRSWYGIAFIVPLLLNIFISLLMYRYRKLSSNISLQRKHKARRTAEKLLKEARRELAKNDYNQSYSLVIRAINEYIGNKLSIPSAGLTLDVVRQNLAQHAVDTHIIDTVSRCYEQADMARFMPSAQNSASPAALIDDVHNLLKQLEKHKW